MIQLPALLVVALKTAVSGAIGSILARTLTAKMVEDLLFWVADIAVKSTKTLYDDQLFEKIKNAKPEAKNEGQ
jgi:hypothetical protein